MDEESSNPADKMLLKVTINEAGDCKYYQTEVPLLCRSSEVFEEKLKSAETLQKRFISIEGFSTDTVKQFLTFIRTQSLLVSMTDDDMLNLLKFADKYVVKAELKNKLQNTLKARINLSNVLKMYQAIHLYNVPGLVGFCETIISAYFCPLAMSPDFKSLDQCTAKRILSLDTLHATEVEVYNAAYRWSSQKCKEKKICTLEQHLLQEGRELFQQVRYNNLTEDERKNGGLFDALLKDVEHVLAKPRRKLEELDRYSVINLVSKADIEMNCQIELEKEPRSLRKCLRFIPKKGKIYLVGFRSVFREKPSGPLYMRMNVFQDGTIVKNYPESIHCMYSSPTEGNVGKRFYNTFILDRPLRLRIGSVYTVKVGFIKKDPAASHYRTQIFATQKQLFKDEKHFKLFGQTKFLCSIYYIDISSTQ